MILLITFSGLWRNPDLNRDLLHYNSKRLQGCAYPSRFRASTNSAISPFVRYIFSDDADRLTNSSRIGDQTTPG